MEPKTIAYTVYILIMFLSGLVLGSTSNGFNTWQYWVITFCLVGCYFCGRVTGD